MFEVKLHPKNSDMVRYTVSKPGTIGELLEEIGGRYQYKQKSLDDKLGENIEKISIENKTTGGIIEVDNLYISPSELNSAKAASIIYVQLWSNDKTIVLPRNEKRLISDD